VIHQTGGMRHPNLQADAVVSALLSEEWTEIAQLESFAWVWLDAHVQRVRACRNWAKARAFVRVYPYALFWHMSMCKQLCAPGGKWAERDRAAFEADFICR